MSRGGSPNRTQMGEIAKFHFLFIGGLLKTRGQFCPNFQSPLPYLMDAPLFQACRTKCPASLQCSAGHFDPLSDIFLSWWPAILFSLAGHFPCIEPCWTKCPAMLEPSAGHQQKSAEHVRHISRGLVYHCYIANNACYKRMFLSLVTLTFDIRTWPRYLQPWPACRNSTSSLYVCLFGQDSETARHTHT